MNDAGDSVGPDPRVVVLILTSAFLHVKISVKVFRVYLGMVTSFWSTFVLGGGGNVTFHGIYSFPWDSFIVNISMHFWTTLDITCSGSQGDLVSPVRGGAGRALYEERLLSRGLCGDFS